MDYSYVKSIFYDMWDDYQLSVVSQFGNKVFWDYLKDYDSHLKSIHSKYMSAPVKYYKRRLSALAVGLEFTEKAPARNIREMMDRGV